MAQGLTRQSIGGAQPRSPESSSRDVVEALPDMLFRLNRNGEYLGFEPGDGVEPFAPPDQLLGRNMKDVLPPDVAELVSSASARALDSNHTQVIRYELPMPDGAHSYEARVVALDWDQVLAIVRDITVHPVVAAPATDDYGLTSREMMVLRLAAAGGSDKQIATELHIATTTVQKHIAKILRRMGAQSRTEACVRAVRENIID